jgi:hypothetical protein
MADKKTYYKLGDKASSFFDPVLKLKLVGPDAVAALGPVQLTRRLKNALHFKHIVEATEKEYNSYIERSLHKADIAKEPEVAGVDFSKMTKSQLVAFYKNNYEVTTDDVKLFQDKTKDQMVSELTELEED